jgi:hypothetical protein
LDVRSIPNYQWLGASGTNLMVIGCSLKMKGRGKFLEVTWEESLSRLSRGVET